MPGVPSGGPAVDRAGTAVIDPTWNVKHLVKAATRRQDDLRKQEARAVREVIALHIKYADQLRSLEAERINALRAVDVGAVQHAAEVQATAATALAIQVAGSAETLRNQVQATAVAAANAQTTALLPITKAIEELSKAQYQLQGEKAKGREGTSSNQWLFGALITVVLVLTNVGPHLTFK